MDNLPLGLTSFENDYAKISVDKFPIVYIDIKGKPLTDEELNDFTDAMKKTYSTGKEFSYIMSFTKEGVYVSGRHRMMFVKWMKDNIEIFKVCKMGVFIMPSFVSQALLKGMFMIAPPSYPYNVVKNMEEAENLLVQ